MMTGNERIKMYRAEARRYKRKYLILKQRISNLKKEVAKVSLGKWYVGRIDGKADTVVLLDEVIELIDKCLKEVHDGF